MARAAHGGVAVSDLVIPYVIHWHGEPEPDLTGIDDPIRVPFWFAPCDQPDVVVPNLATDGLQAALAWSAEDAGAPPRGGLHRIGTEGMSRNNQAQNRQTDDVVRIPRLTPSQRRELHEAISGQNYGFHDVLEIARDLFGK
jgi:hypothetical protein